MYPYFTYGIQVWGNTYQTFVNKIFLLQKRALRVITCSKYLASTQPLFDKSKIMKLDDIKNYVTGFFMYQLPKNYKHFFTKSKDIHSHNTRTCDDYSLIHCRTNVRRSSFKFFGAKLWNSIPLHIRLSKSRNIFKGAFKKYLSDRSMSHTT